MASKWIKGEQYT